MKVLPSKTQTLSMQQREHHKTEMMRKRRTRTEKDPNWYTLPPSPSHSFSSSTSSSSDFEFTISISPRNSSTADELFYKGQLLPLHPSSSSFPLFPDTATDSSRPSSATEDDNFKNKTTTTTTNNNYFSFSRFSSVFGKPKTRDPEAVSVKPRMRNSAKDVIRKYLKKVKPLYEKLSQQRMRTERSTKETEAEVSHSFLGYPLQSYASTSCPSSMRSSPSHSSVLSRRGFAGEICYGDTSSTEELQSAIQEAIAHCKNSLIQSKSTMFGNEM